MMGNNIINVGIGFVTGRKSFKKVLNTYIYNWKESGLIDIEKVRLNLFICYDLNYNKTKAVDFTYINDDLAEKVDEIYFIDSSCIAAEINDLLEKCIINKEETELFFSLGYAAIYHQYHT